MPWPVRAAQLDVARGDERRPLAKVVLQCFPYLPFKQVGDGGSARLLFLCTHHAGHMTCLPYLLEVFGLLLQKFHAPLALLRP